MENTRYQLESEIDVKDLIVIDNGTDTIKMGYSGEDYPRLVFQSVSGELLAKGDNDSLNNKPKHLFGSALKQFQDKKYDIKYHRPIKRGAIENWELMQELWRNQIEEGLHVTGEPITWNIMIIDQVLNSKENKKNIAEFFFEELKISSLIFMNSATLSLLSTGNTSGLVIESGEGVTSVVPIYESLPIMHAVQQNDQLAGQDVTEYLYKHLQQNQQFRVDKLNELETHCLIQEIKHKLVEVPEISLQYSLSREHFLTQEDISYELPDGIITITADAKYKAGELLFDPSIIGKEKSIQYMIEDSLLRCDPQLQIDMMKSYVICGGNSMLKGFPQRIQRECSEILQQFNSYLDPSEVEYKVESLRKYSSWIGGSMLGSLSTFQNLAIQKAEYDENPDLSQKLAVLHKRTFF